MMKSGQGASAIEIGNLQVGAVSAVNALGDSFDREGKTDCWNSVRRWEEIAVHIRYHQGRYHEAVRYI